MSKVFQKIKQHIHRMDSRHLQIASGFLWVSLFVLVGKLAGAAKEMALAWRYGVSSTVDAYVFVLNLINWPVSVWFSILCVVILPLFTRLKADAADELPRFRAELLGLTVLIGFVLAGACWLLFPTLLHSDWLGLPRASLEYAIKMTEGLAILGLLGALISFFSACLLAAGRHLNTLFEAIPALALLLALVLLPGVMPEPLIWGTIAGYALHVAALGYSLSQRGELRTIGFVQRSPAWRFFWTSIGIMALGQALGSLTSLIDQFFAIGLGEGVLSTLSYAYRILALLLGLGAAAISRATLPVFSEVVSKGQTDIAKLTLRWTILMVCLALLVLIGSWLLAPSAVSLLFERGAFTSADTRSVSSILRYSLFQIIFYFPSLVMLSMLAAQRRYTLIAASGAMNLLSKLLFSALLVPTLGVNGLVLSTVLMYAASFFLLAWFVFGTSSIIAKTP